jgi:hypothetical protein
MYSYRVPKPTKSLGRIKSAEQDTQNFVKSTLHGPVGWIEIVFFMNSKNQPSYFINLCFNMLCSKFGGNLTTGVSPPLVYVLKKCGKLFTFHRFF